MAMLADIVDGVIGIDTHRDTLAAAAVTQVGGVARQDIDSIAPEWSEKRRKSSVRGLRRRFRHGTAGY